MNKQGKTNPMMIILVLAVIGLALYSFGAFKQSTSDNPQVDDSAGCNLATTFSPSFGDALSPSTSVSPHISAKINGGQNQTITSSTSLQKGNSLDLLFSASGYQKTIVSGKILTSCGVNNQDSFKLKALSAPTVAILTSPANTVVDNATTTAVNNLTTVSAGGSLGFGVKITGTDRKTTGDMVILVEVNKSVDSMILDGQTGVITNLPNTYASRVSTNSKIFKFEIPAIEGAQYKVFPVTAQMRTSESYGTGAPLYISVLGKDGALDSTGNYFTGVETSDGRTRTSAYDVLAVAEIK